MLLFFNFVRCVCVWVCFVFVFVECLPTMYKYNENRVLEPDLVPVSSTVIPLPIYKVSSGYKVEASSNKDGKIKKPEGPISLITVNSKTKKPLPQASVKKIVKKEKEP